MMNQFEKIKSQIEHGELLPMQIFEMMLEARGSAEPFIWVWQHANGKVASDVFNTKKDCLDAWGSFSESGRAIPLYAQPVQAAVPDWKHESKLAFYSAIQTRFNKGPFSITSEWDSYIGNREKDFLSAAPTPPSAEQSKDREALNYLMDRFDNEIYICCECGHEESTRYMDSAYYLRNYLSKSEQPDSYPSAEQPTLKLPRRKGHSQEDSPAITNQKRGWDDCLDEVARLNAACIEQPDSLPSAKQDDDFTDVELRNLVELLKAQQPDSAAVEPQIKDYFEVEKLANKYCEQRNIGHLSKKYVTAVNAFCIGYRMAISKVETTVNPQRINEQDAREIYESAMGWVLAHKFSDRAKFKAWFELEGRTLLTKLNENREPDYKAQLIECITYLMEWQVKNVNKWHNEAYDKASKLLKAIAKASVSTDSGVK